MEELTFQELKARRKQGARGQSAQNRFQDALAARAAKNTGLDFDRLYDARSALRGLPPHVQKILASRFPAQPCDFIVWGYGTAASVEVKETAELDALPKKNFSQFARLMRRARTGTKTFLVVCHAGKSWRVIDVTTLPAIAKGSWDLRHVPVVNSAEQALDVIIGSI